MNWSFPAAESILAYYHNTYTFQFFKEFNYHLLTAQIKMYHADEERLFWQGIQNKVDSLFKDFKTEKNQVMFGHNHASLIFYWRYLSDQLHEIESANPDKTFFIEKAKENNQIILDYKGIIADGTASIIDLSLIDVYVDFVYDFSIKLKKEVSKSIAEVITLANGKDSRKKVQADLLSDKKYAAPKLQDKKAVRQAERRKITWNADRQVLEQLFFKLINHRIDSTGLRIIDASPEKIRKLIDNNFEFSRETDASDIIKKEAQKLIYNGDIAALIRLLYYLSLKKSKSNSSVMRAPDMDIHMFVHSNFLWFDKEEKRAKQIELKTLADTWSRTKKVYGKAPDKLMQDENNPHKKENSLILTLSRELDNL